MPLRDVTREGVEKALREFDRIGRDAMIAKYGGRPSTRWHIEHEGKYYDQKLVLRAAHQLQDLGSIPPGHRAFTARQARRHVKNLGFRCIGQIQIKHLPSPLLNKIVERLGQHTVGFLRVQPNRPPELIGCGVLVSAGGARAILTAHHVIEALPEKERMGLLLEKTSQPQTIDREGIVPLKIARGTNDSGPDLGAMILAPSIAGSIGSIKSFYNLDKRRDQMLYKPPDLKNGVWVAQGLVAEKTAMTPFPDGHGATVTFNGDGLFGCPENVEEVGGYDYLDYPPSFPARQTPLSLPRSWGGMSGSGLWQIPLKSEEDNIEYDAPLLSGILFRERKVDGEMWITCHGRKSVYEQAFKFIQECKS